MSLLVATRRALLSPQLANWWDVAGQTCIAAYAPKGSASLAASYVNLTGNATYNAAPGVAPTWDATGGWTFNGTTQYLTTGVVPGTGYSMIVRFSDVTGSGCAAGSLNGTPNRFHLFPRNASNLRSYGYDSDLAPAASVTSGVLCIAGGTGYYNSSSDGTTTGSTIPAFGVMIAARNASGAATLLFPGKIQAFAIYSTTLSAGDVAEKTTAMNAL